MKMKTKIKFLFQKFMRIIPKKYQIPNISFKSTTKQAGYTYIGNMNEIYLCFRAKNINVLFYVCIHEYTHLVLKSVLHDAKFWKLFNKFVKLAIKHKLLVMNFKDVILCGDII